MVTPCTGFEEKYQYTRQAPLENIALHIFCTLVMKSIVPNSRKHLHENDVHQKVVEW